MGMPWEEIESGYNLSRKEKEKRAIVGRIGNIKEWHKQHHISIDFTGEMKGSWANGLSWEEFLFYWNKGGCRLRIT